MFVRRFLPGWCRRMYISPAPGPQHTVTFSTPCSSGDGKTARRPPRVAGVEVEVAASAQLSKRSGGEPRGGCETYERARTLFRLQQTAPSLSFSGTRPSGSPLTSSSSRAAAAPLPPLLPSPPPPCPPSCPARGSAPIPPHAPRGEVEEAEETHKRPATWSRERAGRKGHKKFRAAGGKSFWWRRVLCRRRRRLVAALPLRVVWASGLWLETPGEERGCRLRGCPRGRPVTSLGDLSRPSHPALEYKNAGFRLSAHAPAAEGHFLKAGKTHSPAARMGGGSV